MLEKAEQGIWPSFVPLGYLRLEIERSTASDHEVHEERMQTG
jgi:hypothetical protein